MSVSVNITESDLRTALVTVLTELLPAGWKVINLQQDRVAMPNVPFVGMTQLRMPLNATPVHGYDSTNPAPISYTTSTDTLWVVQLDFCGSVSSGAQNAALVAARLLRDDWGYQAFLATGIAVNMVDVGDPKNTNFINDQNQFEDRWTLEFTGEFDPSITVTQDFASALNVELIEVDTTYPPGAP